MSRSDTSPHWLVPDGWTRALHCLEAGGEGVRLLWYEDSTLRIEHRCNAGDGTPVINAPLITKHDVAEYSDGVTITPSILCKGCGLHGFITKSRWRSA